MRFVALSRSSAGMRIAPEGFELRRSPSARCWRLLDTDPQDATAA
jgi:hypothetical protein